MAGPGRPFSLLNYQNSLNGTATFLGRISSAGVAKNNATTTTPFNFQPQDAGDPANGKLINYMGTLAGKSLILQSADNAFLVLAASDGQTLAQMALNPVTVATGVNPGLRVGVGERFNWVMGQTQGWLQLISETGTATVQVWELNQ